MLTTFVVLLACATVTLVIVALIVFAILCVKEIE